MQHFIILDDDITHNMSINKRLELIFKKYGLQALIALSTTNPNEVLEYSSNNNKRNNVYLLDVNVQSSVTGIDVAGSIRELDVKAYVVFISGHPEFVLPSLKTKVFDYLIKPVSAQTLETCINLIYQDFKKLNAEIGQTLTIKSGFTLYNIKLDEITYLEKYGHLLEVHTVTGKIQCSESLESMELKLDKKRFFRCHRSYIVNLSYISRIDSANGLIYLKNGEECPVSKRCKKELKSICCI